MNIKSRKKAAIVGVGQVGATTAYTLLLSGLVTELVLIDVNEKRTMGEVLDLAHGIPLCPPADIYMGKYEDLKDADIVIISAGANQKPGETRMDLAKKNAAIFKSIVPEITRYAEHAILLVVTNPVDILTYITQKISGLKEGRVLGSGTVLDTSRLRYLLSRHTGLDARNIHTYVLGEHGDTELAAWSLTSIAGMAMDEYCMACGGCAENLTQIARDEFPKEVRDAAYTIIDGKGATYYAVALAVRRITEAILRDEKSILTVSSPISGPYGLKNVCLSLPTVVGAGGVERLLPIHLNEEEEGLLRASGAAIRATLKELGY